VSITQVELDLGLSFPPHGTSARPLLASKRLHPPHRRLGLGSFVFPRGVCSVFMYCRPINTKCQNNQCPDDFTLSARGHPTGDFARSWSFNAPPQICGAHIPFYRCVKLAPPPNLGAISVFGHRITLQSFDRPHVQRKPPMAELLILGQNTKAAVD
jgi:hypothetical protein